MMGRVTVPQAAWYRLQILVGTIFLFSNMSRRSLRPTQPSSEGVPEFFPGIKAAKHEVNCSHSSGAEVTSAAICLRDTGIASCYRRDNLGIESQCGH